MQFLSLLMSSWKMLCLFVILVTADFSMIRYFIETGFYPNDNNDDDNNDNDEEIYFDNNDDGDIWISWQYW